MGNTAIHTRFRIDSVVHSEGDTAAARRDESRQSKTCAFQSDFSRRTRLGPASGCNRFALFYFVVVAAQILIVTTASTTRQPQGVSSARNRTVQSRLSSYERGVTSSSTEPENLSLSVPTPTPLRSAPTPTPLRSAPTPIPLRSAPTATPLQLATSSSSSSSSSLSSSSSTVSQTATSPPIEISTLLTPPTPTLAIPPSKPAPFSSSIQTSATKRSTLGEDHTLRTTDTMSSQSTFLSTSSENKDTGGKGGLDYLIAKQILQGGDLVNLKRQMDYQRQEIRTLRLQLAQNNDQIIDIQREFMEFREKQLTVIEESTVATLSTGKDTQTTSAISSSPELKLRSTSHREMLEPLQHFTLVTKEQEFLTNAFVEPITSPEPLPKPATTTNVPQIFTTYPEKETISKSPSCSDCSKHELRLFELRREFYTFQKQVNKTFSAILSKLIILEKSEDARDADVHLKKEPALKVKKTLAKSAEREILKMADENGGRKVDSGVMNYAIRRANLSKQKIRSRKEKGKLLLPTEYTDSALLKHHASKIWSTDSGRKTADKEQTKSSEDAPEDVVKQDTDYKLSDGLLQELGSINEKVQHISDRLEDLEEQLVSVKENTSLSIKYVTNTLRGNSSLVDSYINQHRGVDEKKETDREQPSKVHSLNDHTIEDSRMRSKKNDTAKKEHLSTSQKVKNGDPLISKSLPQIGDFDRGSDRVTFSKKSQFRIPGAESVHHNLSWLFENVQSIHIQIYDLDTTVIELSCTLSKLSNNFPFEVEQKNETIEEKLITVTEKSTSDHLGRLLSQWSIRIHKKTVEKVNRNKSISKDEHQVDISEVPEQETNSSQGMPFENIMAVNQSEEWKSGSQMISDSAEQLPEATYGMLEAVMSWINELEAQIQKLKMTVDEMKTKIANMMSTVEELYTKDTKTEDDIKEDAVNRDDDLLLVNSTVTNISETDKQNAMPTASSSPVYPQATPVSTQPTTLSLANISDIHERFLRNRSIATFENSGTDMSDSTTQNYIYNFTELEHSESNKSAVLTTIDDLKSTAVESATEMAALHLREIRITDSRNKSSAETRSLEAILENVHGLLKRVKKLESQVLDLSEVRPLEATDSELPVIQTDYLGSGTTEEVPLASLEIVHKIAINMTNLQIQITNIKTNMTLQENQLNAVKNDVFILDENMEYMERELSDLELKQRRDDRFYYSQQIIESNLSLVEVADQVAHKLAPGQQLTNQHLKELNDSLSKQWVILDRLRETATLHGTNISRITKTLPISQEKILYVDLKKRRYKIYNSTSVVKCSSMKDAERTFLNKKTQTCYYGYGNKKMLPYSAAKRKCEDAGLHMVFMETPEEHEYVAKEITQEIGGHWIGAEKFDYGWYWVRGCDAVDRVFDPPWRYNHSVSYTRAIIWGDKWSGKYARQYYRFVCEEEPFKEEICDGFRSFERVHEWSSDAFFRSFNTLHEIDCGRMCLADPDCKGFRFRKSGHHKCALYNRGNTTTKKKTMCDVPGEVCYKRIERCFS